MKKPSEIFKSIRFAKGEPRDKPHLSTDNEEHYTVGEKEWNQQVQHAKKMAMQEKVKDKFDIGEYDQEGDMAKSDLRSIIANAQKMHDMIDDADNLPEWVQSKITKAEDYISTVANYMNSEMSEEVEQIDELSSDLLGRYKTAAGADASKADKAGDYDKGNKRFSGIVKATKKQFANDMKKEEVVQEGRPSQRHPLEGHDYHKKTNAELEYIAKDAHKAAEAMKSHNTTAENKYRDQANDSATVRHYRKTHGMADWYKKKYGHMSESTKQDDKSSTALSALVAKKNLKQAEGKNKSQEFINKMTSKVNAGKRLGEAQDDPPFDKPYTNKPSTVTDKSGAKHSPMSRARDIARTAAKKQSEFLKARNAGSNTKNARARAAGVKNSEMFESRQAEIVREAMKVAKEKKKKGNSEDKFIADPELNSRVIKTAAQM